jgi:hypothetical protein
VIPKKVWIIDFFFPLILFLSVNKTTCEQRISLKEGDTIPAAIAWTRKRKNWSVIQIIHDKVDLNLRIY